MTSLNFEVRYVRINDIEIKYIAVKIAAIQTRRDVQRVMIALKVIQPKLTKIVGLRNSEAYKASVVRTVVRLAVNDMCPGDRLRSQNVNYAACSAVHSRTLA
jgi:hypothetical protein